MDYVLHVSSYAGTVPGARHFRGRVQGERPRSCHGGTTYHGARGTLQGKTTCAEGHELPRQIEWDVDEPWTRERYDRWVAKDFEGDGPGQFLSEARLIEVAILRFLGDIPQASYLEPHVSGEQGDRLFYGWVGEDAPDYTWDEQARLPEWGAQIAEVNRG